MYFEKPGEENTEATLIVAREIACQRRIAHLVVASTSGATGLRAVEMCKDAPVSVVVVTHNTGFRESGEQEFDQEVRRMIEELGGKICTGTMVLRGLGAAVRGQGGYTHEQIVADTLRVFGQGTKVCMEIAAMVVDAGLIPCEEVIAVAGTGRGADTAIIIKPDSSNHFFLMKVKEILAKPREF
ncbi:MAG: hypothetical protein JXD19_07460 [Deltaproteobacteria bacterium]|nr:hypothetical protein [Deltaproteobacteria bacterium]